MKDVALSCFCAVYIRVQREQPSLLSFIARVIAVCANSVYALIKSSLVMVILLLKQK